MDERERGKAGVVGRGLWVFSLVVLLSGEGCWAVRTGIRMRERDDKLGFLALGSGFFPWWFF